MSDPAKDLGGSSESTGGFGESRDTLPQKAWSTRFVVAGLCVLAAVAFIVQNRERVETRFLFLTGTPRLWVVIVVSMALGAGISHTVGWLLRRRRKKTPKSPER